MFLVTLILFHFIEVETETQRDEITWPINFTQLMDDRARIQTQAIQESGLLNVTNEGRLFVLEGSHQGPFRGLLPAVPHELCLLALRDAPAAHRGGRRL